jgi:hypothetical protein
MPIANALQTLIPLFMRFLTGKSKSSQNTITQNIKRIEEKHHHSEGLRAKAAHLKNYSTNAQNNHTW